MPWFVTAFGALCAIFGLFFWGLFGTAVHQAFTFTYNGAVYPDDLSGLTVTMKSDISDPDGHYSGILQQFLPVTAHVSNGVGGEDIAYFYLESAQLASGHPWYLYASNLPSLTQSSGSGARFAYDGSALGWWGTVNNNPPTITFAPSAAQPSNSCVTTQAFIRYIVDNSDYYSRYGYSGSIVYPTSWSNANGSYYPSTRTVTINVPSTNGTSFAIGVAVFTDTSYSTVSWQQPSGITWGNATEYYGTFSYSTSVVIPNDVSGFIRVRVYYSTASGGSITRASQDIPLGQVGTYYPNVGEPPVFGTVNRQWVYSGDYDIQAYCSGASSVVLQYLDNGIWTNVKTLSYDTGGGFYWFHDKLPHSTGAYQLLATNSNGSSIYDLGYINANDTSDIVNVFGDFAAYVSNFFEFMHSFFSWLPDEITDFLIIAIMAVVILGVVQLVKP